MKIFIATVILTALASLSAAEKVSLVNTFEKSAEGWNTPRYWNGSLSRVNGRMKLIPTAKNGKTFGRCTKMILPLRFLSGSCLELEFEASGKGSVTVGTMVFPESPKTPYLVEHQKIALSQELKTCKAKINLSKVQTDRISLTFEIPAATEMIFDNIKLKKITDDKIKITVPEVPVMRGKASDIKVRTNAPGKEFSVFSGCNYFAVKADNKGIVTIPEAKIALQKDNSSNITVACNGTAVHFQTSTVPSNTFDKNLALARKAGKEKLQIVWFGDSELDFDRSRNTPAQVNYYLNAAEKQSSFFNFAVAGDSLLRVDARLSGRYAPRPEAYLNLAKAKPDLVIVMLGHNDTMTRSTDNFSTSQVPVEKQISLGSSVLKKIRTRYPEARVLLVSPLALDGKFLKSKIAKPLAAGKKNLYWFGSPVMLEKFTANWKKVAGSFDAEFLDIYTPMSKIADRLKFFKKGDEVHLNADGHVWLTEQILTYLAKNSDWSKFKKYSVAGNFEFKSSDLADGKLSRGSATLSVTGKRKINSDGALEMDGRTTALSLTGVAVPDIRKGFTLDLVCKYGAPAGNDKVSLAYDALFYAPDSFVLARYQRSFYLLYFDGKKYQRGFLSPAVFDLKKPRTHHIAMTCKYHEAVDQGEIWTEIQIFVDGKAVVSQKLPKVKLASPGGAWEFAGSSRFGRPWNFGGKVYGGSYFNRILTEKEIRDRVLKFKKIVTPAFRQAAQIPADVLKKIADTRLTAPQRSGCLNLAKNSVDFLDEVLKNPQKYLLSFGKKKVLTLLNYPGKVRIISLYDTENKRELFNWNNSFFELHFLRGNEKKTLSMTDLVNDFAKKPETKQGVTSFTISHLKKTFPAVTGKSYWKFDGSRLEYALDAASKSYVTVLDKVTLPALNFSPLDEKDTSLVVPEAGGLLYENAVAKKVTYTGIYPRMLTSMQCGAVYDKKCGIYFSPGDPQARMMNYAYRIDSDGLEVKIDRPAARATNKTPNTFSSRPGAATVQFFKGDWYDAGLIYRQELERNNALWWRKTLPNTDTPEWFRNNSLKLLVFHIPEPEQNIQLRKYLEQGFIIQHWYWWERGPGHHLCPIPRANTEYIAYAKLMKPHSIRVISYTNGRLWSTRDKRGESTLYKTLGAAAAVKKANGEVQLEPYGVPCAVLCPASPIYQKSMFDMLTRLVAQGVSGCFIDQLGAARPILCQVPGHGHGINDPASWNVNGHRKAFLPVREYWKKNKVDAVTLTEDNSEHCVGLVDALCPWRWMHDNQIPLHAMVYSGRTQYTSRDPVGSDLAAPFVKTAVQLVQGEQMGHFGIVEITSPAKGVFRRYLKRLLHLRTASLDFFNCGMMKRPPRLEGLGKKIYTRWGNHGTKDVGTLPVVAGAWELNGSKIILLVNTTNKSRTGKIAAEPAALYGIWKSGKKTVSGSLFSLEPYGCELRLYGNKPPRELLEKIEKSFAVIRRTFTEKDPFGVDKMTFPDTPVFKVSDWQQAAASPLVLGARVNREQMVLDNVFYGVFFAGTGDFGKPSKGYFEVEVSAPTYSGGGNIEIMLGHPDSGTCAGKMICDRQNVLTDTWNDYRKYRIPALQPLGGKHKIFFKLNGGSVCNFRNWRYIPGR